MPMTSKFVHLCFKEEEDDASSAPKRFINEIKTNKYLIKYVEYCERGSRNFSTRFLERISYIVLAFYFHLARILVQCDQVSVSTSNQLTAAHHHAPCWASRHKHESGSSSPSGAHSPVVTADTEAENTTTVHSQDFPSPRG